MSKVAIVKCQEYRYDIILKSLEKMFKLLDLDEEFIKENETVLLKPNLLSASPPERGITTHPEFVRAVVKFIKQFSATALIGDSSSAIYKMDQVYRETGMFDVARKEKVELVNLSESDVVKFKLFRDDELYISKLPFEVSKIISLPKLKTHNLTVFTGAIKNLYGLIPGILKAEYHRKFPNVASFYNLLCELVLRVKPHFSIVDGIVGMDTNGPHTGRLRNLGVIFGGQDAVAVDSVFIRLIGLRTHPLIESCYRKGLGEKGELVGDKVEPFQGFKLPSTHMFNYFPNWLLKFAAKLLWFRPKINDLKCKRCRKCIESCPVSAIDEEFEIDVDKCIKCLCCHEVCPSGAVEIELSKLAKFANIFRTD